MQTSTSFKNFRRRRVLVVGLGLHGGAASAVRWLIKQGAIVRVTDKKNATELAPTLQTLKKLPVTFHLGGHRPADFHWAQTIYQNQDVPDSLPELRRAKLSGVPIINEVTIFFQHCPAMIIGVTGTRGKSTTTALLGRILQADFKRTFVSGNIRQQPMLDLLPKLRPGDRVVLELSSFQLEFLAGLKRGPRVAVMTNLLVDHLNRYGSLSEYATAKYNIFRWQKKNDLAVLNWDSAWVKRAAKLTKATIYWFAPKGRPPASRVIIDRGWVVEHALGSPRRLFSVADWPLPGEHQLANLLAAVATARALQVAPDIIRQTVKTFAGLPHRQEIVRTWRGHVFVNDTSSTTPDATQAAIQVYPKAAFVVGGTDKRLSFLTLAHEFAKRRSTLVFLPGTASDKLWHLLRLYGYRGRHAFASSMGEAVRQAVALARTKQAIILSPGAASFGLFRHEFDRGEQFIRAVKLLR